MKKVLLIILMTFVIIGLFGYEYTVSGSIKTQDNEGFVCMVPLEIYVTFIGHDGVIREDITYGDSEGKYSLTITDPVIYNYITVSFAQAKESVEISPGRHVVVDLVSINVDDDDNPE